MESKFCFPPSHGNHYSSMSLQIMTKSTISHCQADFPSNQTQLRIIYRHKEWPNSKLSLFFCKCSILSLSNQIYMSIGSTFKMVKNIFGENIFWNWSFVKMQVNPQKMLKYFFYNKYIIGAYHSKHFNYFWNPKTFFFLFKCFQLF